MYEFQAKKIFSENGIKVPRGIVVSSSLQTYEIVKDFGAPVVIKSQVLVGGRGLAGGIYFANDPYEARSIADKLIGIEIKNEHVFSILIEEEIPIKKEYYLGSLIDYDNEEIVIIASSEGGVDIETIAHSNPNDILKLKIDPYLGLTDFNARRLAKSVGLRGRSMLGFARLLKTIYKINREYDATLVEINPIALTEKGEFIAVDAKMILDDNASFRHRDLFSTISKEKPVPKSGSEFRKYQAEQAEIPTYIEMDGDLGIISDGAGTGMLTLDLTKECGLRVGVYCELGGKATPTLIEEALRIISSNQEIKIILVNLIGGLNRMDEMAQGITSYMINYGEMRNDLKIVVRMSGTLETEGRQILAHSGISSFDNIYDAIDNCIKNSEAS